MWLLLNRSVKMHTSFSLLQSRQPSMTDYDQAGQQWMTQYIHTLIDTLQPHDHVLIVGFGNGEAAQRVQQFHPKHLTILDADPKIAQQAKAWAQDLDKVTVIEGTWQTILPTLSTFDTIFFNEASPDQAIQFLMRHHPEQGIALSDQIQKMLNSLEERLAQLKVSFSDQEIEDFYQQVGQFHREALPKFFQSLKTNGNITETQYTTTITKYQLDTATPRLLTPMLAFLKLCLEHHMHPKSRFSCFLPNTVSKYEDPLFFDLVITRADVTYQEHSITLKVPPYPIEEALVMVVEKT